MSILLGLIAGVIMFVLARRYEDGDINFGTFAGALVTGFVVYYVARTFGL